MSLGSRRTILWLGGEYFVTHVDSAEYWDPVFRSAWVQV